MTDEHFISWQEINSLDSVTKLWGVINQNLTSGIYTFAIENSKAT